MPIIMGFGQHINHSFIANWRILARQLSITEFLVEGVQVALVFALTHDLE